MKSNYYILIFFMIVLTAYIKPSANYKITIERKSGLAKSESFHSHKRVIYIVASDDLSAYQKGLIYYYSTLESEIYEPIADNNNKYFTVTDLTGSDICSKLSKRKVDSLTQIVKGL